MEVYRTIRTKENDDVVCHRKANRQSDGGMDEKMEVRGRDLPMTKNCEKISSECWTSWTQNAARVRSREKDSKMMSAAYVCVGGKLCQNDTSKHRFLLTLLKETSEE